MEHLSNALIYMGTMLIFFGIFTAGCILAVSVLDNNTKG